MEIIYKRNAQKDLAEINKYLSQFYPSTLANFYQELREHMDTLSSMPYIGVQYHSGYRKLSFAKYLVFYKVDKTKDTINVYRIVHGARDTEHLL
ncbi:plasmid stabilization protein [Clostridia bacterium]|nr:plasmid stabilization protein [Clostridia bacterium]